MTRTGRIQQKPREQYRVDSTEVLKNGVSSIDLGLLDFTTEIIISVV